MAYKINTKNYCFFFLTKEAKYIRLLTILIIYCFTYYVVTVNFVHMLCSYSESN